MSVNEKDVPKLSLIDQLKMQHQQFCVKRDHATVNLQQLQGAIYACEVMIKKHEDENCQKGTEQEQLGEQGHGGKMDPGSDQKTGGAP